MWQKIIGWFGGRSHFSFVIAFIAICWGFAFFNASPNYAIFAGTIASICGLQHYRSIKEDAVNNAKPD